MSRSQPSSEPADPARFTREWDRFYTRFAPWYDAAVERLPLWKGWLRRALPHIVGPRVLEVSFGTGYLLAQYSGRFAVCGLDYNRTMVTTAAKNLRRAGARAALVQGDVAHLPYPDACFDSVVNTMAFSGYPDGARAMAELGRVLRPGGRIVMIDFSYPADGNWLGARVARLVERSGDVLRPMGELFGACGLSWSDEPIGAWGSVHLYLATRPE